MFYRHTHKHYKRRSASRESKMRVMGDRRRAGGSGRSEGGGFIVVVGVGEEETRGCTLTLIATRGHGDYILSRCARFAIGVRFVIGENFGIGFPDLRNWVYGPKALEIRGTGCTQRGECGEALSRIEVES